MQSILNNIDNSLKDLPSLFFISIALSLPVIILGENVILLLPLIFVILCSIIYGEKFIVAIVIISLFILVGDLSRSLRSFVYIFDFSILGYFFLKKYGLNFKNYPRVPRTIIYFLILYLSALILSSIMSKYPFAGVGLIAQQASFFIITYVFYALIQNENDIKLYFISIFIVAFVLVSGALYVFLDAGIDLLATISPNRPRISVIITNIEASTNFFVVSFPLLLSFILVKNKFSDRKKEYLLLIYLIIGLLITMSRSAIIAIIFSTAIIFFLLRRKRFYQLMLSVTGIVLIFLFYPPLNELLTTFLRIESGFSARDFLWQMSVDMIKDNPVFGLGPGVYKYEMLNYFPYMLDDWWGRFIIYLRDITGGDNLSHNFFLTLFTEMGILGILTAVFLPVVFIRIGIKTIKKFKSGPKSSYYLIIALFATGSSIILRNFFNGIGLIYVGGIHTDLPFWIIFGSLVYYYRSVPTVNAKIIDSIN